MAPSLPDFHIRHLGLKTLALVLALVLWYLANDSRLRSTQISRVPLQFQMENLPPNMYHDFSGERYASFNVRGPAEDIGPLRSENFLFRIPLQSVSVGSNTIVLDTKMISKVNLNERAKRRIIILPGTIVPYQIDIYIDYYKREVPIEIITSGEPAPDHTIKEKRVAPETVLVTGAPEDLERLTSVNTDTLDITNIDGNVTVDVMLDFQGLNVKPVDNVNQQVKVEFVVEKE